MRQGACRAQSIGKDVNIVTSAHTGFADLNAAFFGFADLNTAKTKRICGPKYSEKLNLLTLLHQNKLICGPHHSAIFGFADHKTAKICFVFSVHHTGFLQTFIFQRPDTPDLRTLIV